MEDMIIGEGVEKGLHMPYQGDALGNSETKTISDLRSWIRRRRICEKDTLIGRAY